jgi:hypothetical protein
MSQVRTLYGTLLFGGVAALQVAFFVTMLADVRCITDAIRHSDCVIVCTDWEEFKCIDWRAMASEMQV